MKIQRPSANTERLEAIAEMAAALVEHGDQKKYSMGIEFALAELVRDEMRTLAQAERWLPNASQLLDLAVDSVMERVEVALGHRRIGLDFKKYIAAVREKLAFPAKEIQKLSAQLGESRQTHKLGSKEELVSDAGSHLVVHELGLRDAIQGLLVEASEDRTELNLDNLREQPNWRLQGEWFPYELYADDFIFVIDDDGSIFVSTANLPLELRHRASELLRRIADLLYT